MSTYPASLSDQTTKLTAEMVNSAAAAIDELAERGFEVHLGLTQEFARAIIQMCLEPGIKEYCPNDCGQRFKDLGATQDWLNKGRAVFLLLKREGAELKLAGYGWSGRETSSHVPDGETTFAIRIGEIGQGQGLATPFSQAILAASTEMFEAKNIWLETWQSNGGAVHIYHKVGFVDVDQVSSERPTAQGHVVADTRLYMSLSGS
jgi:ribosomal protein S18 acetylase RimI-like enzyme